MRSSELSDIVNGKKPIPEELFRRIHKLYILKEK